ncbi:MAG: tRNA (adenosine(37)-N6)-dimethylallyltransferase MiaA [Clostridia bacterium]|nr:tRNA (adenosine(37)-N6)-dimethylallyltransferase MiaA [Clostridia bacterium]
MKINTTEKIPVVAVVGPTASGKTAMAIELAKIFNAEIVSADSMQIYKGMDIASAKPDEEEMQGIRHHLIDFLDNSERYSVARYIDDATAAIKDIRSRNKNVIVCGGTGLYIDSLLKNIIFEEEPDNSEIRENLRTRKDEEGIESLYNELKRIDPVTAESLHINNEGRILRAIETYYLTGELPSALRERSRSVESPYEVLYIGLNYEDRDILYDRINARVEIMVEKGLITEAKEYFSLENKHTAAQAIGHKEIIPYLSGELSLKEAKENLKKATRHYAKRQMTWFRRNTEIHNIYCDKYENFSDAVNAAAMIIKTNGLFKAGETD